MKILALDTATKSGSVAITEDETVLAESFLNLDVTHSETLLPALRDLLDKTGLAMRSINLFAVTLGPGSFTGVRIGVSTVKGFAFAMEKPVVGVSTLEAVAMNFSHTPHVINPILDARRGEVYTAAFQWEGDRLKRCSEDRAISPEELIEKIGSKTLFAGDGLIKYGDLIKEWLGNLAEFAAPEEGLIRASVIAKLGLKAFERGETLPLESFTPEYLRKSEAEVQREKRLL